MRNHTAQKSSIPPDSDDKLFLHRQKWNHRLISLRCFSLLFSLSPSIAAETLRWNPPDLDPSSSTSDSESSTDFEVFTYKFKLLYIWISASSDYSYWTLFVPWFQYGSDRSSQIPSSFAEKSPAWRWNTTGFEPRRWPFPFVRYSPNLASSNPWSNLNARWNLLILLWIFK